MVRMINLFIVNLGNLGLDFTSTYLLAKKKYSLKDVNSNCIISAVGIGVITFIGYLTTKDLLHNSFLKDVPLSYTLLAFCITPFSLYYRYWGSMMIGLNKIVLFSKFNLLSSVIGSIVTLVVMIFFKGGIRELLALWALSMILSALIQLYLVYREDGIKISFQPQLFKEALFFGFKGQIGNIAARIYTRFDIFLVNFFQGATGVGYYSLSVSIAEKIQYITSSLVSASNLRITEANKEESGRLTAQVSRHTVLLTTSCAIGILLISPWALPFLYGVEYLPSLKPLMILLLGMVFLGIDQVLSTYFTGQLGKPQICSIVAWVNLFINIPMCVILTMNMGITGTALAIVITYFISCSIMISLFLIYSKRFLFDILLIKLGDLQIYFRLISKIRSTGQTYVRSFTTNKH